MGILIFLVGFALAGNTANASNGMLSVLCFVGGFGLMFLGAKLDGGR
jgi:hypothetical protein